MERSAVRWAYERSSRALPATLHNPLMPHDSWISQLFNAICWQCEFLNFSISLGSVPRLSLRFYSLTPTFVKYDGSTNRKWHRSLWIWLQQVWDDEQDILIRSYELHVTFQKMFQRIRNMSQCIRNMFELTWRSCFNVSVPSGKLL